MNKLKELTKAWKGIEFPGADLIFHYDPVPELRPDFEWMQDLEEIPDFALTGNTVDSWTVAWKATINGKQYGTYFRLNHPTASFAEDLKNNYLQVRKEIESN